MPFMWLTMTFYDIIELYEGHEKSEIMDMLASKYPKEDMEEAFEEIETLIKEESLFTEDIYKDYIIDFKKKDSCQSVMSAYRP